MPNWCYNTLTITGNNELLEKFFLENKTDDSHLSFSKSVSPPDNIEDLSEDDFLKLFDNIENMNFEGASRWYKFNVFKWGTKWDANEVSYNKQSNNLAYTFDTAWSPPLEWVKTTSKKYPEINFNIEAEESGMNFYININYRNGEEDIIVESTLREKKFNDIKQNENLGESIKNFISELDLSNFDFSSMECYDEILENFEDDYHEFYIEDYFEHIYESMKKIKKFINYSILKKNIQKMKHYNIYRKVTDELIEFHYSPPNQEMKLLKRGGKIYQNAESKFVKTI